LVQAKDVRQVARRIVAAGTNEFDVSQRLSHPESVIIGANSKIRGMGANGKSIGQPYGIFLDRSFI
jgi:hypothetical protein